MKFIIYDNKDRTQGQRDTERSKGSGDSLSRL